MPTTEEKILKILREHSGISGASLAKLMGVKINSLYPVMKIMQENGDIIKQGNTRNAIWYSA